MSDGDDKPIAAMYDHCVTIYNAMMEEAEPEFVMDTDSDTETTGTATGYHIFEGATTRLFAEAQLAAPYYTSVMTMLKRMGCVEALVRGGGAKKSKWRLVREPSEDLFHAAAEHKRPTQGSLAQVKQMVNDLTRQVNDLNERLGQVLLIAESFSEEIKATKARIQRLEATLGSDVVITNEVE